MLILFFIFYYFGSQSLRTAHTNKVILKLLVSVSPQAIFYAGVFLQSYRALLAAFDSYFNTV